jgi:replicative DNA helicase
MDHDSVFSLDLIFVKAALSQENGFNIARQAGISGSMLHGDGAIAWDFICNHYIKHGELPSDTLVQAKLGIILPDVEDGIKTLISELKGRKLYEHSFDLQNLIVPIIKEVQEREVLEKSVSLQNRLASILDGDKRNISDVTKIVKEFLDDVYRSNVTDQKIGNLFSLGPDVWDLYTRIKNKDTGIKTPWPGINDATMGWWPGNFIVFVARAGVGKTNVLLHLARQAWLDGHKVLFVGTEMGRVDLAMRFFAFHFKLPYVDFRHGKLGTVLEKQAEGWIRSVSSETGINIVGDDFDPEIDSIISAAEQTRPDIVFVDGLYLVKNRGHDQRSRVANTSDDLKRAAKRLGIPFVTSTQFNREAAGNSRSDVSLEKIGMSDVVSWNGDVIYGLFRDDDMIGAKEMGFRPLKIREGQGKDFYTHWNFETMDFSQKMDGSGNGTKEFNVSDYNSGSDDDGDPLF